MIKKRQVYFLLVILFCVIFVSQNGFAEKTIKIVILHTNDMHGHMFPYENSRLAKPPDKVGGFQYLSSLINKERKENPGSVLLLDGGDISQGSLYSNIAYGIPMIDLMNYLGYDATVIGNHEFDWGYEKLESLISAGKFSVLSANILSKETGSVIPGAKPYIIKDINGIRIGIIGLTTTDTSVMGPLSNIDHYYFVSPEMIVRRYIPIMKRLYNADLLIVLSHLGYKEDVKLASHIPEIDIIVGSHSHTPLEKPVLEGHTLIVQAGNYMAYLGRLEIEFDTEKKKITSYDGKLINILDSQIEPDTAVSLILDNYMKKYNALAQEIVGEATVDLTKSSKGESTLGNFVADIMREKGQADIGLINSGGLREEIPAGKVTMEKVYGVYPFENVLVTMELKGKYIKNIMEKCVYGKHAILQVSGMKIKYDLSKPLGERLVEITIGGKPLEPDATYRVATADFLALGGDGYDEFKYGENIRNIMLIRELIVNSFKLHSPVSSKVEGRIEFVK